MQTLSVYLHMHFYIHTRIALYVLLSAPGSVLLTALAEPSYTTNSREGHVPLHNADAHVRTN